MTDELKRFPVTAIKPLGAEFVGTLEFNPYTSLAPVIWYNIEMPLAEIDLGEAAPAPDICGTTVDTILSLGGIVLPHRRWQEISGTFGPIEDQGASSIYVSNVHNPIDILRIEFRRLAGVRFKIDLDLGFAFEHECSGFADTKCSLTVEAEYSGLSFHVPNWSDPESVKFPRSWRIPPEFDDHTVAELFGRFVDVGEYDMECDESVYRLRPRL